jgi:hypothetical protein
VIKYTAVTEFRRLGSSLEGVSYGTLSPYWATNVETVGASTDDVPTLPTLGWMVLTMGSTANAFSLGALSIRWLVRKFQPEERGGSSIQENWTIQNAKPDHPVSLKSAEVSR